MDSFLSSILELGNAFIEKQVSKRAPGKSEVTYQPSKLEHLYGCALCNHSEVGCKACWDAPFATRPASRAKPEEYHWQRDLPDAPTFRPTAEEFNDPFAYLASIAPEASKAGIALIIPPASWQPPIQMLDQESGQLRKDFKVPVRIQPTHLLCRRYPTPAGAPPPAASEPGESSDRSSPGRSSPPPRAGNLESDEDGSSDTEEGSPAAMETDGRAAAVKPPLPVKQKVVHAVTGRCSKSSMQQQQAAVAAAAAALAGDVKQEAEQAKETILNPAHLDAVATAAAATDGQFGYEHLEEPLSLFDFHRYADWAKRRHFNGPLMTSFSKKQQQQIDAAAAAAAASGGRAGGSGGTSNSALASLPVNAASNAWRTHPITPAVKAARGVQGKFVPGTAAAAGGGGKSNREAAADWQEPDILEVEAEFWRIVEAANEQVEALYGQDVDTATYRSAFPTIRELSVEEAKSLMKPGQLKLQHQRLKNNFIRQQQQQQQPGGGESVSSNVGEDCSFGGSSSSSSSTVDEEPALCFPTCACGKCQLCNLRAYTSHPWNINNLPQAPGSVLRFVREDVGGKPITGLMVPWLYVGSCFSAFCWHIEDHGLYSVNYNHMGAPKVWYGVPAMAAAALDAAMRDALPHLFEKDKLLLHKLITMLSPNQLRARGVPVCRAVQVPGSFIVTFPDAYHSGFNSGFNVAEAVNFAAPDWLPFGSSSVVRYRCESRYMTFSHDQMLINVVKEAAVAAVAARVAAAKATAAAAAATTMAGTTTQLALPGAEQQAAGGSSSSSVKPPKPRRRRQQEEDAHAEAAEAAAAAVASVLAPPQPAGLRAQFAAGLDATIQELAAAEVAAAEAHWQQQQQRRRQQQQQQLGCDSAAAAAAGGSSRGGDLALEENPVGPVRTVCPPPPAAAAAAGGSRAPAVSFATSALDSSFWWEWYDEGSWAEAAQVADESAVLSHHLWQQGQQEQQQAGDSQQQQQQQQHHEHHTGLAVGDLQFQQHHLSAASTQHHQGQRERVFTMRGAAAGPAGSSGGSGSSSRDSAETSRRIAARAARGLAAAVFATRKVAPAAAAPAAAAAAVADNSKVGSEGSSPVDDSSDEQQQQPVASKPAAAGGGTGGDADPVSAIAAYIMHLADNRRSSLLVQPPKEPLARAAVGELALRLELEQQRQKALMLQAGISNVGLMQGTAVGVDPLSGLHVNTQGVECATCGCDLSLAAVISHADTGRAVCPAHYADLDGVRSERQLLLRYPPGHLERLLAVGVRLIPGAEEAVREARGRYSWVAGGRFIGGTILHKPGPAAAGGDAAAGDGSEGSDGIAAASQAAPAEAVVVAAVAKQEAGAMELDSSAAHHPQQKVPVVVAGGAVQQQQQQQPVVEVKLLGRLYDPARLSGALFEDLGAVLAISNADDDDDGDDDDDNDGDDDMLGQQSDLEADAGEIGGLSKVQDKSAAGDGAGGGAEDSSGGDASSGSWWGEGETDAFGFYKFADGGSSKGGRRQQTAAAAAAEDSSDDDFRPVRGRRKRRRGAAAAGPRKRAAAAAPAAAAAVMAVGGGVDASDAAGGGVASSAGGMPVAAAAVPVEVKLEVKVEVKAE